MSSQVIGNIIAAIVLQGDSKKSTLFIIFAIMAVFGSILMLCLRTPKASDDTGAED